MNNAPIRIHPAALEEADAATEWYSKRSTRVARMFLNELDRAVILITEAPELFPVYTAGTRRVVLHRFPYAIIFRETIAGIEILAVAHGHRLPGYWRDRVG